jgi:hypothetical protein
MCIDGVGRAATSCRRTSLPGGSTSRRSMSSSTLTFQRYMDMGSGSGFLVALERERAGLSNGGGLRCWWCVLRAWVVPQPRVVGPLYPGDRHPGGQCRHQL